MRLLWLGVYVLFIVFHQTAAQRFRRRIIPTRRANFPTPRPPPPGRCLPTNWNYAWSKVGRPGGDEVWFTRTRDKGEWHTMAEKCAKIDPGRSAIASIRSAEEQKNVITDLPDENWWIGGVRLGGRKWYWAAVLKAKVKVASMVYKYWDEGEPNNHGNEYCMHMYDEAVQRKWNDINCFGNHFRAICEIRCKNGLLPMEFEESGGTESGTRRTEEETDSDHDHDDPDEDTDDDFFSKKK